MSIVSKLTKGSRERQLGDLKFKYAFGELSSEKLVAFLQNKNDMSEIDINGSFGPLDGSLLTVAVRANDLNLFKCLKQLGASDVSNLSILTIYDIFNQWCVREEIFDYFIQNGFDIESGYGSNTTALVGSILKIKTYEKKDEMYHLALELYKRIIYKGANVNNNAEKGLSPLMAACKYGFIEVVRELIGDGADVTREYYIEEKDKKFTCYEYLMWEIEKNDLVVNNIKDIIAIIK